MHSQWLSFFLSFPVYYFLSIFFFSFLEFIIFSHPLFFSLLQISRYFSLHFFPSRSRETLCLCLFLSVCLSVPLSLFFSVFLALYHISHVFILFFSLFLFSCLLFYFRFYLCVLSQNPRLSFFSFFVFFTFPTLSLSVFLCLCLSVSVSVSLSLSLSLFFSVSVSLSLCLSLSIYCLNFIMFASFFTLSQISLSVFLFRTLSISHSSSFTLSSLLIPFSFLYLFIFFFFSEIVSLDLEQEKSLSQPNRQVRRTATNYQLFLPFGLFTTHLLANQIWFGSPESVISLVLRSIKIEMCLSDNASLKQGSWFSEITLFGHLIFE